MGLSSPENKALTSLPGSPQEPAPAPGLASWTWPKPRRARGRRPPGPPAQEGVTTAWQGPRWPGAWFLGWDPTLRPSRG